MKLRKSNLDEQQERRLLEIESRGCWLAFWGLLLALIVESVVIKDSRAIIGEWILFNLPAFLSGSRDLCRPVLVCLYLCTLSKTHRIALCWRDRGSFYRCAHLSHSAPRGTSHKKAPGRTQRRAGGRGFSVICLTMKLISGQQTSCFFRKCITMDENEAQIR